MDEDQQENFDPDGPLDLSSTGKQSLENSTEEKGDSSSHELGAASSELEVATMDEDQQENFDPDKPLDLSSPGKQSLENSTDEKSESFPDKLEAASSSRTEKREITLGMHTLAIVGKHTLPINKSPERSRNEGVQLKKNKQGSVSFAQVESQHELEAASSELEVAKLDEDLQENFDPDEPLDLSSTGMQSLENSTDEKDDSSSDKLEAASSLHIDKRKIPSGMQTLATVGTHALPVKVSPERRIQPRKSVKITVTSAQVESQVEDEHRLSFNKTNEYSLRQEVQPSTSEQIPVAFAQIESQDEMVVGKPLIDETSKHSPCEEVQPSTSEQIPVTSAQVESEGMNRVNSAQAKKASSSQTSRSAATSSTTEKPRKSFRFNEEQRKILNEVYKRKREPNKAEKTELALQLNVEYEQVCNWFHRRVIEDINNGVLDPATLPPFRKWNELNEYEKELLEVEFINKRYPTSTLKNSMAKMFNIEPCEIISWFRNRRKKDNRTSTE